MATDWAADVRKFVPEADSDVIKAIVRYCGIALQKPDSSLVSYGDPVELGRVRQNFLRKKLGLTDTDDVLDKAIAAVGERMKGVNFKNRVTVYYLLLEQLGLLHMFSKRTAAGAGAGAVASAAPMLAAAMPAPVQAPVADRATRAEPYVAPQLPPPNHFAIERDGKGGLGLLLWLLAGLALLWALWILFTREVSAPAVADTAVVAGTRDAAIAASDPAVAAPAAAAPVVVPAGAGVTSEVADGKPLVKVYFDTGKAEVVSAFTPAAATLKTYLSEHPGSAVGVSGYNDPTGNAAANAALSKRRAQAVQASLVGAGIAAASIELIKPEAATDTEVTKEEARRVEVYIK